MTDVDAFGRTTLGWAAVAIARLLTPWALAAAPSTTLMVCGCIIWCVHEPLGIAVLLVASPLLMLATVGFTHDAMWAMLAGRSVRSWEATRAPRFVLLRPLAGEHDRTVHLTLVPALACLGTVRVTNPRFQQIPPAWQLPSSWQPSFCSDAEWREDVTRFLSEADYVVLDLSTSGGDGIAWERKHLVRRGFPSRRIIKVSRIGWEPHPADEGTVLRYSEGYLARLWIGLRVVAHLLATRPHEHWEGSGDE